MEYFYDIYGFYKNKDFQNIEAFLSHFGDRSKIESRKREVITLIPDVPMPEKHQLFKNKETNQRINSSRNTIPSIRDLLKGPNTELKDWPSSAFEQWVKKNQLKEPEPETVKIYTLTQAIELGVSSKNKAFSIYIPNYTRKDVKCLIVHFTLDNKVILGVSVTEKDKTGQDNFTYVTKIRNEIEEVVPAKASGIMLEQPAPDSEADFLSRLDYWQQMNEDKKEFARTSYFEFDYQQNYSLYRYKLHRKFREVQGKWIYGSNLSDYFTFGDNQDRITNIIKDHGDRGYRRVENLQANDIVKIPFLGSLLHEALSWKGRGFEPANIHRISIPPNSKAESIWIGHRDGVSDWTTYQGLRTTKLNIEETYCLDNLGDLKRLAEEGFFQFTPNQKAFEEWLIKYHHKGLYLDILQDEDFLLRPSARTFLFLVGKEDWESFLSYLQQNKFNPDELKDLLSEMCKADNCTARQIEDVFNHIPWPSLDVWYLFSIFSQDNRFEQLKVLFSQKKEPAPLPYLIQSIKVAIEKSRWQESYKEFIYLFLQTIEKDYGSFCDYPFITFLAAQEDDKDLFPTVLKLLPESKWQSNELYNIALATENEYLLRQLNISEEKINKIRQEEVAFIQNSKEDKTELIQKATKEGNYFQVAYLAPLLSPKALENSMINASGAGILGIVKLLVEVGRVAPDCSFNSPIRNAKYGRFHKLEKYLLSKGVPDVKLL